MSVLVYTENWNGAFKKSAFELASYAKATAALLNSSAIAVTVGKLADGELEKLANYGIEKMITIDEAAFSGFSAQAYGATVAKVAIAQNAEVVIFGNNPTGEAIAPRVAVRLDAGLATGAMQLPTNAPFTVRKRAYSGKAFADFVIESAVKVITLTQNSFKLIEQPVAISEENFDAEIPANAGAVKVTDLVKASEKLSVNDAEILVSAGRGLKGPENWGMIEEMADILGGTTCCSRPVSDLDWRPHSEHVGQTGKVVAPNLYIAVGISGAIQHLAGVNSSKVIVVINTDADAPFFEAADYGIVGDAFDVVPKLNEALKAFKANS